MGVQDLALPVALVAILHYNSALGSGNLKYETSRLRQVTAIVIIHAGCANLFSPGITST